jgi:hypothetical protein
VGVDDALVREGLFGGQHAHRRQHSHDGARPGATR